MRAETVGAWNAAMDGSPVVPAARLVGRGGLVVISPHPDDESLGCSALLLDAGESGRRLGLVALTDGEASHRRSKTHPPARLAALRAREQAAALTSLGCGDAEILRLALPDGASGRHPDFAAAVLRVAALCDRIGATSIAAPHPDDPHPDHHASAELALRLREARPHLRVLLFEVWSRRLEPSEPFRHRGLHPFRVATDTARKRAALDCHRSQLGLVVTDDPDGFVLPDWFLAAQSDPLERFSWLAMPGAVPDAGHFARLYADGGDPWHVRSSAYEADKREASIRALGDRRYGRVLEAGCGEGFLTRALVAAGVADEALGFDREPAIVARAARFDPSSPARFTSGSLPDDIPDGAFDLVILSEILYFLDEPALTRLAARLAERLVPGGHLLLVFYLGPTDTPLSGRDAADVFVACFGADLRMLNAVDAPDYRIERLEWRPAPREAPAGDGEGRTGAAVRAGERG